ncbi:hypothetical protein WJX74_009092 [Apatococcus lobatus]|uniref:Uncharacterized protein n=1 Tax=Apatococcus lobatus TaxID=904363 RepID=A0AAW1RBH8_9CHLO
MQDLDGSGSMIDAASTQQMPGLPQADGASPSPSEGPSQEDSPGARENQVVALMAQLHAASSANLTSLPQAPRRMRLQIISDSDQAGVCRSDHRQHNLQALVPHPEWQDVSPIPLAQLYSALIDYRMDIQLPLPHMHPAREINLGQIEEMPMPEFAAFAAPCAAYLAFCSPFCRDPTTHAGRSFCQMAAEALCVQIVLCEARPADSLTMSGQHLLQASGVVGSQAVPVWSKLKHEVGLTESQQQAVREVWQKYSQNMVGVTAEAVVRAADLSASLELQRESYIHLLRVFTVQILTPFQFGHFMARSYPYNPAWGEIVISIAEP